MGFIFQNCQNLWLSYKPIKAGLQKHIKIRHEIEILPYAGPKSFENIKQQTSTPPSIKKLAFGKIIFKCKHCDCKCKSNFSIILHLKNKHSIERKDSEQHFERILDGDKILSPAGSLKSDKMGDRNNFGKYKFAEMDSKVAPKIKSQPESQSSLVVGSSSKSPVHFEDFINSEARDISSDSHELKDKFYCEYCEKTFSTSSAKNSHDENVHGDFDDTRASHQCKFCQAIYVEEKRLTAHMRRAHNEVVYNNESDTASENVFEKGHLEPALKSVMDETNWEAFYSENHCKICNISFEDKKQKSASIFQHFKVVHGKNNFNNQAKYFCPKCQAPFGWFQICH